MLCSVSLFQMSHRATKWLRICLNASWHKFRAYLITHRNSMCVSLCKFTLSGWALWKSQKWPECLRQEHKAWCLHVSSHEHPCDRLHVFCGLTDGRRLHSPETEKKFLVLDSGWFLSTSGSLGGFSGNSQWYRLSSGANSQGSDLQR